MQKGLLSIILLLLLNACATKNTNTENIVATDTLKAATSDRDTVIDMAEADAEVAHYFVVIADTGRNYVVLRDRLSVIRKELGIIIDTMGRYYNSKKDRIVVPEGDEDEMYAGEYFPRRFPSESSSIEYLNVYIGNADEHTMAAVTGIYEQRSSADSACKALQKFIPAAFVTESDLYIGCMH